MMNDQRLKRHRYDERRKGRYIKSPQCDGCNKPVGTNYYTDDEVCQGSDGPGFFLCDRARCLKQRDLDDVEARRRLYTEQRAQRTGART